MFTCTKINVFLPAILLILSAQDLLTSGDNIVNYVGAARNLTVNAFESVGPDGEIEGGLLKLNISWLPPTLGKRPVSYSVILTTIQNESMVNPTACQEETLYYTTKNESQLGVVLPEDPIMFSAPEISIIPGCVYGVQVYANPRKNAKIEHPSLEYRVPKCVGAKCSCAHVKEALLKPEITLEMLQKDQILITWQPTTRNDNIKSYVISFGVLVLISRGGLPVYNKTEIARVSSGTHSFVWSNISSNLNGIIYVVAEDLNGCSGPQGTHSISLSENDEYHRRTMMIFVGSVIFSVMILGIASVLWPHDRKPYDMIPSNADMKDLYSPAPLSQCLIKDKLVLTQRNVFYVEQEIEEAMQKGQADALEMSYHRLNFKEELGKGQFGKVYRASIEGFHATSVAVKVTNVLTMHDDADARAQMLEEIAIMKTAGPHPHLVQLIGCCTLPTTPVCAILEYLECGDLLTYLHRIRKCLSGSLESFSTQPTSTCSPRPSVAETLYTTLGSEPPTTPTSDTFSANNVEIPFESSPDYVNIQAQSPSQFVKPQEQPRARKDSNGLESDEFLRFALEIAKGMQHLEAKGITHRDLAARNILLDANLTLKVSDFGLSRNGVYVIAGSGRTRRLPVRWMSPEAMRNREFSSKSDVWSYGVVLWEIGTLGAFPYPDVRDDQLLRHVVIDQKCPTKPDAVSDEMYAIMQACWASHPCDRPHFSQLLPCLLGLAEVAYFSCGKSNPCYAPLPPTEAELQE